MTALTTAKEAADEILGEYNQLNAMEE